jgi:hypothetical protein
MTEEISMKDLQMKGLTEKLTKFLNSYDKSKRKELDAMEIKQRLKEFQMALDGAHIELRHLTNETDKLEWKMALREHKNSLKELKNEWEFKENRGNKDELFEDYDDEEAQLKRKGVEEKTTEELMKYGFDTQKSSKESLQRTLGVIEQTKDVGTDTVLKLEANTAQIEGLYDSLESIESSLARSTKVLKRIARKMATDKAIWVVILILIGVIVAVIVLKVRADMTENEDTSFSSTGAAGI